MEILPSENGALGVEVRGVDAATAGQDEVLALLGAVHRHALIRLKNQKPMSVQEYKEFGLKLGSIMPYPDARYRHPEHPEVFVSSNVKGRTMGMARSGYFWHTDLSFKQKPQPLTVLMPQLLPEAKRETLFINMADVHDALPGRLREAVDGRTAKHDPIYRYKPSHADVDANYDIGEILEKGRQLFPAPTHPCVFEHPVNGRRVLYVNEGFTTSIDGLPYDEGQAILKELFEFIKRPEHVHAHAWALGDVIIWDNRMLIHRAGYMAPGDYQTIFRLGIDDGVPFYPGIAA